MRNHRAICNDAPEKTRTTATWQRTSSTAAPPAMRERLALHTSGQPTVPSAPLKRAGPGPASRSPHRPGATRGPEPAESARGWQLASMPTESATRWRWACWIAPGVEPTATGSQHGRAGPRPPRVRRAICGKPGPGAEIMRRAAA
jgi:hypothetical protein